MIAVRTFDRFTRPGKKGEQAREFFVLSVQPDITGEGGGSHDPVRRIEALPAHPVRPVRALLQARHARGGLS